MQSRFAGFLLIWQNKSGTTGSATVMPETVFTSLQDIHIQGNTDMKNKAVAPLLLIALLFSGILLLGGCESPEEKAANFAANGDRLFAEGKLDKARLEYRNALQLDRKLVPAWYGLARIADRKNDWKKAYAFYEKVVELEPKHLSSQLALGKLNVSLRKIDKAEKNSAAALEIAPEDPAAHALAAIVAYQRGDLDASRREADIVLKKEPGDADALVQLAVIAAKQGDTDAALAQLDKAIEHHPDDASLYRLKIVTLRREKRTDEALATYRELIRRFPKRGDFKKELAGLLATSGKVDEAEKLLRERIATATDETRAIIDLSIFLRRYRTPELAEKELSRHVGEDSDPTLSMALAELYMVDEKKDRAKAIYQRLIERHGSDDIGLKARNRLATLELSENHRNQAAKLADEVLAVDKENFDALLIRGRIELAEGKDDRAISDIRAALKADPNDFEALHLLARTHMKAGRWPLAKSYYVRAIQARPRDKRIATEYLQMLLKQRDFDEAAQVLEAVLKTRPKDPELLSAMVIASIGQKNWKRAAQYLERLHSVIGDTPQYQRLRGLVAQGDGRIDDRIDAFEQVLQSDPGDLLALTNLLNAYLDSGRADDAGKLLDKVIAQHPNKSQPWLLKGQLEARRQHWKDAARAYRKAIDLDPRSRQAYQALVDLLRARAKDDEAITFLDQARRKNPDNPLPLELLGELFARTGQTDRAIEVYQQLVALQPDNDIAANNLASLLGDTRQDTNSLELARKTAQRFADSDNPFFRDTLGWLELRLGNTKKALELLKPTVEARPDVAVFHYHLGMAYLRNGDHYIGRRELAKAVEMGQAAPFPGLQEAKRTLNTLSNEPAPADAG